MEGYIVTKDITWQTTGANGAYRAYVFRGTVYIPKLNLKLEPRNLEISQIAVLELRNVEEFGLKRSDEPKLRKIAIDDSKAQTILDLLKERNELPRKLEDAVKEIINQELP